MSKENYFQKAITWAKKNRLTNIKANWEDFDAPSGFHRKGEDASIVPDITGRKLGKKFYIEIAMKADNMKKKVSKWKLLSTLASLKGGKLYLLAPRGHKAGVQRELKRFDLPNTKLVYLK